MTNLYKWYVCNRGDTEIIDALNIFSPIYERLGIDPPSSCPNEVFWLYNSLKRGIIEKAKEQLIIPGDWGDQWFDLENYFLCTPPVNSDYTDEEIQKIIDDFNNWSNLNMDIQWSLRNY